MTLHPTTRWHAFPSLKEIVKGAYVLPSLATAVLGDYFQFEQLGHFGHGLDPREACVQHDCCGRAQAVTIGRRSKGRHCLSLSLSDRVLPSSVGADVRYHREKRGDEAIQYLRLPGAFERSPTQKGRTTMGHLSVPGLSGRSIPTAPPPHISPCRRRN
nr:uncharacterized protein LOC127343115 isoform X3 [Lolium perenne]